MSNPKRDEFFMIANLGEEIVLSKIVVKIVFSSCDENEILGYSFPKLQNAAAYLAVHQAKQQAT